MVDLFLSFWDTSTLISLGALQFVLPPVISNFSLFSASSPESTAICFTNPGHSDRGKMKSRSRLNLLSVASVVSLAETLLLLLLLNNIAKFNCQLKMEQDPSLKLRWPLCAQTIVSEQESPSAAVSVSAYSLSFTYGVFSYGTAIALTVRLVRHGACPYSVIFTLSLQTSARFVHPTLCPFLFF